MVGMVAWAVAILLSGSDAAHAAEDRTPINIVLLGDSYSAGNGAGFYETGECLRSTQNWASRYVEYLRNEGYDPTFINRACSGAETEDVLNRQEVEYREFVAYVPGEWTSPSPQLVQEIASNHCSRAGLPPDETWEISAEPALYDPVSDLTSVQAECTRYRAAQISVVGEQTDLVLLTIGGNDGNFSGIIRDCFAFTGAAFDPIWQVVTRHFCEKTIDDVRGGIEDVEQNIQNVLVALEGRLRPDARVALLSYPYLELGGYEVLGYPIGQEVRELGDLGDNGAANAATAVNSIPGVEEGFITFLDGVKDEFAGHEPDGHPFQGNPDRWIYEFERIPPFAEFMENFHPNPLGHLAYRNVLIDASPLFEGPQQLRLGSTDIVFVVDPRLPRFPGRSWLADHATSVKAA
jgi:lysophospholipase L1-like esterase